MSDHTPRVGTKVRRLPAYKGHPLFSQRDTFTITTLSPGRYYFTLAEDPFQNPWFSEYFEIVSGPDKNSGFKKFQQKIK